MEPKPQREQSAPEDQVRAALDKHWQASASGDLDTEHEIYADDSISTIPSPASASSAPKT